MADVNFTREKDYLTFNFSVDEIVEVRKAALAAAVVVYHGAGAITPLAAEAGVKNLAKKFEEHLMRGVPKSG
jgi:hypothetical protein